MSFVALVEKNNIRKMLYNLICILWRLSYKAFIKNVFETAALMNYIIYIYIIYYIIDHLSG